MGGFARRLFGISTEEASFARRGFAFRDERTRLRLEAVGKTFLFGYHAALVSIEPAALSQALESLPAEDRGFAVEGAAMAAALLDALTPWRKTRLTTLLEAFGDRHVYMIHVGAGWAWARLGLNTRRQRRRADPLLGWLALDGYGFHEGYFYWARYAGGKRPKRLEGYELRAFDQGLGRSAWFVFGGQPDAIAAAFAELDRERHGDLWSGVGLAATYAGGVDDSVLVELRSLAGAELACLAQGAAFAAEARRRAGLSCDHTERACRILAGTSTEQAAAITSDCLTALADDGDTPAFDRWRVRIRERLGGGDHGAELHPAAGA